MSKQSNINKPLNNQDSSEKQIRQPEIATTLTKSATVQPEIAMKSAQNPKIQPEIIKDAPKNTKKLQLKKTHQK